MEEKISAKNKSGGRTTSVAIVGGAIIAVLLILSTLWINWSGQQATNDMVHSVSEAYLRELTDRREQGIASRINDNINDIETALKILTPDDLSGVEKLSAFLGKMRTIQGVDQFAFANADGQIFTPEGLLPATDEYFCARNCCRAESFHAR